MFGLPPTSLPVAHLSRNDQHIDGQTVAMNDLQHKISTIALTPIYTQISVEDKGYFM
jgi:hypothetical protein